MDAWTLDKVILPASPSGTKIPAFDGGDHPGPLGVRNLKESVKPDKVGLDKAEPFYSADDQCEPISKDVR